VWANDSGASGAANVRVIPGALASILVTPDPATLSATDAPLQFLAWGFDAKGNARPANPSWSATGGSVDTATGIYTPGPLGTFTVYANDSGISGSASVTVTAGPLSSLVVSPATTTLTAGTTQAYTASGFDALGNPVAVTPAWAANGGSMNLSTGLYTATAAGAWTVYANDSGMTGTATVNVNAAPLTALAITPDSGSYAAGSNVTFALSGEDAYGNPVDPTATMWTWGAGGLDLAITATTLRLRLPDALGPFTVTATEGTAAATANLLIVESALTADPTSLTIAEDAGLTLWDLTDTVAGDASANLRWASVTADDPTLATFAAGGFGDLVVRVTPLPDRHGSTTVTFVLENRTGHTATGTATLTITGDTPETAAALNLTVPLLGLLAAVALAVAALVWRRRRGRARSVPAGRPSGEPSEGGGAVATGGGEDVPVRQPSAEGGEAERRDAGDDGTSPIGRPPTGEAK